MRGVVRDGAQDRPGIYRMLSPEGEVVYVGKSKRVRTRLLSYFRCAYPEDKGARILREATTIDWEYTPSEFSALLTELRLIKRLRPRFNVAMKRDARHYAFIKLSRGAAPKLLVVRGAGSEANPRSVYEQCCGRSTCSTGRWAMTGCRRHLDVRRHYDGKRGLAGVGAGKINGRQRVDRSHLM